MAENETNGGMRSYENGGIFSERFEPDSIIRDVVRQWWVILIAAVAAALIAGAMVRLIYTPEYTSTVTFMVSKSGVTTNAASDSLSAASALAETFETVADSSIMETRVCRALGLTEMDGEISVSIAGSSNLMTMTVTSSSPRLAYEMVLAGMDTAEELCAELTENISVRVLQEPGVPSGPSTPLDTSTPMKRAGVAVFLLMIVVFGMESYFRDTVKSEHDFRRKVDTKLLASIPHERKYKTLFSALRRKKYSMFMENPTLSFGYVEACRMMGTRVRRELDRTGGQVLAVTSVTENEGKSTVAANLAMALVQEGRRVILVDCDFRKPALYKILGLRKEDEEKHDFGNVLKKRGTVHISNRGMEKNLPVIFSTAPHRQLLTKDVTEVLRVVIKTLRKSVDYVIIDTSPLGLVAESARIAALSDASLLVAEQGAVEARFINDAVDQLDESGVKVLGCVFNNVRTGFFSRAGSYGSYYGYGRSYRYGYYGYGHYEKGKESTKKSSRSGKKEYTRTGGEHDGS